MEHTFLSRKHWVIRLITTQYPSSSPSCGDKCLYRNNSGEIIVDMHTRKSLVKLSSPLLKTCESCQPRSCEYRDQMICCVKSPWMELKLFWISFLMCDWAVWFFFFIDNIYLYLLKSTRFHLSHMRLFFDLFGGKSQYSMIFGMKRMLFLIAIIPHHGPPHHFLSWRSHLPYKLFLALLWFLWP